MRSQFETELNAILKGEQQDGVEPIIASHPLCTEFVVQSERFSGAFPDHVGQARLVVFSPSGLRSEAQRRVLQSRVERDLRRLKGFEHPNVLSIYNFWRRRDGSFAIFIEHPEKLESVKSWLSSHPSGAARMRVAAGMLNALAAAHRDRIFHGDLEPSHIFVTDDMPMLSGFAIGRAFAREGRSWPSDAGLDASLEYAAPEQATGKTDESVDVYGAAALLHFLCAGEGPSPKSLSDLAPALPPALCDLIEEALSMRAEARPPTVEALRTRWMRELSPARQVIASASRGFAESAKASRTFAPVPKAGELTIELTSSKSATKPTPPAKAIELVPKSAGPSKAPTPSLYPKKREASGVDEMPRPSGPPSNRFSSKKQTMLSASGRADSKPPESPDIFDAKEAPDESAFFDEQTLVEEAKIQAAQLEERQSQKSKPETTETATLETRKAVPAKPPKTPVAQKAPALKSPPTPKRVTPAATQVPPPTPKRVTPATQVPPPTPKPRAPKPPPPPPPKASVIVDAPAPAVVISSAPAIPVSIASPVVPPSAPLRLDVPTSEKPKRGMLWPLVALVALVGGVAFVFRAQWLPMVAPVSSEMGAAVSAEIEVDGLAETPAGDPLLMETEEPSGEVEVNTQADETPQPSADDSEQAAELAGAPIEEIEEVEAPPQRTQTSRMRRLRRARGAGSGAVETSVQGARQASARRRGSRMTSTSINSTASNMTRASTSEAAPTHTRVRAPSMRPTLATDPGF